MTRPPRKSKATTDTAATQTLANAASAQADAAGTAPRPTKKSRVIALLQTPEGADLASLADATGWQAHTIRAALTRLRKDGHTIARETGAGGTRYRIVTAAETGETT